MSKNNLPAFSGSQPDGIDFETFFAALPGASLLLSIDLSIQAASNQFLTMLFKEQREFLGKSVWELFSDPLPLTSTDSLQDIKKSVEKSLISGEQQSVTLPIGFTNSLLSKENVTYFRATSIPISNKQGRVTHILQVWEESTRQADLRWQLLASQQREQSAKDEARRQWKQLEQLFEQAPVAITILERSEYRVALANPAVCEIWGRTQTQVVGKPLFEALPELRQQGVEDLLSGVFTSGIPHVGKELPILLERQGRRETVYFNFVYHPLQDEKGMITSIAVVATEVTEQVLARMQVEATAEKLQAVNEELATANEELSLLNQELEQRVALRTLELQQQKARLERFFMQLPASVCILDGPDMRFELVNAHFQQLYLGISLLGKGMKEVLPQNVVAQVSALLEQVYKTGEPFEGKEVQTFLPRQEGGPLEERYFNFIYQPRYNEQNQIDGILTFGVEVTDQVLARHKIEESQQRFKLLSEFIPQIVWTATPEGYVDYYNRQWYTYTGLDEEQSKGQGWIDVIHPQDLPDLQLIWQNALLTGHPYQTEARMRNAEGVYKWFLIRGLPLKDEQGPIQQWLGTSTEINAQKLYTQQLLERETYFREMTDNVPVMIWVTRPDGFCTYLNKPWYNYTGQTPQEALGMGWVSATHPEDARQSEDLFIDANRRQIPFAAFYRLKGKDGTYRWFLDKGEPKFDAAGNFEGMVGAVIDVHEQKVAEDRLQLSVQAGKVGLWEWDVAQNRATYSPLLQEMFGLLPGILPENFEGAYQVFQSVIYPEDRQHVNTCVQRAFEQRDQKFYVEFRIIRPSGAIAWIAERGEVYFEGNQAVRMNGTCIDITDRKRAEQEALHLSQELASLNEELAAANEELRAANEEIQASNEELTEANRQLTLINADLDTFVYTASHDLKSPISNIEGLLKALERRLGKDAFQNPQIQQIYELLLSSVARFKSTIRDLSEVARAGKESPEDVATIALESILEEVQQDLGTQIEEAGAKLEIQLDCPAIHFSRKNLKSICYNLLSNALKYRSEQRQALMRIMCQSEGDYYVLCVEDNGLGIDMRQQDKIFALFKRLHAHVEGTGIGLYIVKKLVENAGGKIEVESQLGVGSTFKVYFKR